MDPSTTASSLENTALVTSSTPDPNPDNNEDTVEVPLLPSADLSVRKESTGGSAVPGTPFLYTITLQNAGPSDAQDVLLTDAVPAELWAPEFSTDSGATWTPWHSPYLLGTLAAGTSRSLLLRGTIDPAATLPLLNTAVAASSTPDPDLTNNTAQREDPLQPAADLAITKAADTDTAAPGSLLTYTLTIANLGPATAQDVLLTDQPPGGLSRVEVSLDNGRTWTPWTRGLFPGGASSRPGKNPAAARQPVFLCPGHPCKHRCGGQLHPGPKPQQQHRHQPGPCPGKHRASSNQNLPLLGSPLSIPGIPPGGGQLGQHPGRGRGGTGPSAAVALRRGLFP